MGPSHIRGPRLPICNLSSACFWKFPHKHSFVVLKKNGQLQWNPETSQSSDIYSLFFSLTFKSLISLKLTRHSLLVYLHPSPHCRRKKSLSVWFRKSNEVWIIPHLKLNMKFVGPYLTPGSLSDSCCIMYSAQLRPANLLLPVCTHLSIKHRSGYAAADSCRRHTHCNGERLSTAHCPQCALSSSQDEKDKLCWKTTISINLSLSVKLRFGT